MDLHHLLLAGLPAHSGLPRLADIFSVGRHVSKGPGAVTDCPLGFGHSSVTRVDAEGDPSVVALASGVPVAAFPVGGPKEVIGDAPVGVHSEDLRAACLAALTIAPQACVDFAANGARCACDRDPSVRKGIRAAAYGRHRRPLSVRSLRRPPKAGLPRSAMAATLRGDDPGAALRFALSLTGEAVGEDVLAF